MTTTLQRYAPSVLSFLVLVIGGLQAAVAAGPLTGVTIAQLAVLVVTTFTTWVAPLIGEKWRGKVKTGLELAGVAITLALPFIATGTITWAEGLLVVVAFIKAGAAELGVQIRLDPIISTPAPALATVEVFERTPEDDEALVSLLSRAGVPTSTEPTDRTPGPDHRADS